MVYLSQDLVPTERREKKEKKLGKKQVKNLIIVEHILKY